MPLPFGGDGDGDGDGDDNKDDDDLCTPKSAHGSSIGQNSVNSSPHDGSGNGSNNMAPSYTGAVKEGDIEAELVVFSSSHGEGRGGGAKRPSEGGDGEHVQLEVEPTEDSSLLDR